jgi:hypothetical protein
MTPPTACTFCGSSEIVAHAPGSVEARDLLHDELGVTPLCWCLRCWPFAVGRRVCEVVT